MVTLCLLLGVFLFRLFVYLIILCVFYIISFSLAVVMLGKMMIGVHDTTKIIATVCSHLTISLLLKRLIERWRPDLRPLVVSCRLQPIFGALRWQQKSNKMESVYNQFSNEWGQVGNCMQSVCDNVLWWIANLLPSVASYIRFIVESVGTRTGGLHKIHT